MKQLDDYKSSVPINKNRFKLESLIDNASHISATSNILELNTPVIGRFTGVFAKLDSASVNGRFYSAEFWRKVIASERVQSDLKSGTMIGIFEHPSVMKNYNEYGQITARHPQNGAFVVKDLRIVGTDVIGEAYLLNTPLGKLLGTYFLAKDKFDNPLVELYISARGYTEKDYFDENGIDQMNPDDYYLQSFDVVLNPGIKGTRVKMESASDAEESILLNKLEHLSEKVSKYYTSKTEIANSLRRELKLVNV